MAIKSAKAISYYDMLNLVSPQAGLRLFHKPEQLLSFINFFDKVWIVSMRDPKVAPIFDPNQILNNVIQLSFDDIDCEDEEVIEYTSKGMIVPSAQHIDIISKFVIDAHKLSPDSNDLLLTNCMMGIRRSGAVVEWASRYCGLDFDKIKKLNPQIQPNPRMSRLFQSVG
jgi:predicted protein tyrosine phosphatase